MTDQRRSTRGRRPANRDPVTLTFAASSKHKLPEVDSDAFDGSEDELKFLHASDDEEFTRTLVASTSSSSQRKLDDIDPDAFDGSEDELRFINASDDDAEDQQGKLDPDAFENSEDERRFLNASEDDGGEEQGEDGDAFEAPGEWMDEDDGEEEYVPVDEDDEEEEYVLTDEEEVYRLSAPKRKRAPESQGANKGRKKAKDDANTKGKKPQKSQKKGEKTNTNKKEMGKKKLFGKKHETGKEKETENKKKQSRNEFDEDDESSQAAYKFDGTGGYLVLKNQVDVFGDLEQTDKDARKLLKYFGSLDDSTNDVESSTENRAVRTVSSTGDVTFRLIPRGQPVERRNAGDALARAAEFLKAMANEDPMVASIDPPRWLEDGKVNVDGLTQRVRDGLTTVGSTILRDLAGEPARLAQRGYWSPFAAAGHCFAQQLRALGRAALEDSRNLPDARPGVYLIVGCVGDEVTSFYVGKSSDIIARTLQHMRCEEDRIVPASKEKRLVYHLLKEADQIYHFPLVQFETDQPDARSMAEGLWCLVLGTYQYRKDWLTGRRMYGLPNVGDQVKGGNSTRCVDKPSTASREEGGWEGTGIQDSRWFNFRQCLVPLMILAAVEKTSGDEQAYNRIMLQVRIMQRQIREHLGKLLRGDGLRFVGRENVWLFGSPLGEPFVEKLMKKGVRWTIRLIDGESDPKLDTILAAKEEDRPLFAGLSLQFQVQGESNWVVYQPFGGDRKTFPRRFAERLVALLPVDARTSREERAALKRVQANRAREEIEYDGLSDIAKDAWDGGGVFYPTGLTLRLGEHRVDLVTKEDDAQRDEIRRALLASVGVDRDWTAPIRCRFRIQEGGESSFARSRWRKTPSTYKMQLLPFAGEWIVMPFQVRAKTTSMHSPSDIFVEVFEELEQAYRRAQPSNDAALPANPHAGVPAQFRPFRHRIKRNTLAGSGALLMTLRPHMVSLNFTPETMRAVWNGRWPVAVGKTTDVHIHIRGSGVRRAKELKFALSRDGGTRWINASVSDTMRKKLWDVLVERRQKAEEKTGAPWEDGIWSHELQE